MLSLINMTASLFGQLRVTAVIVKKVKPYIYVQNAIQNYVQWEKETATMTSIHKNETNVPIIIINYLLKLKVKN